MREELSNKLREKDIVEHKPVTLKSGRKSDYYIDVKKAYGYPDALTMICDSLWQQLDSRTTCIVASGYGGLPAPIIAKEHNLHLTMVRDDIKDHGRLVRLEGYIPSKKDKVSIIDDVLTTGGSLKTMIEAIRPYGAEILGCYVVVKRGDCNLDIPIFALLVEEDLIRVRGMELSVKSPIDSI